MNPANPSSNGNGSHGNGNGNGNGSNGNGNGNGASENAAPSPSRKKRVLLVEGEGFTRLLMMLRLRMAGFQVDFASNGFLALKRLRERHPDAMILDLKLRSISGLDLIKEARGNLVFSSRPIFVFTRMDAVNRNTRKELKALGTKIFDKATTAMDTLVANVA